MYRGPGAWCIALRPLLSLSTGGRDSPPPAAVSSIPCPTAGFTQRAAADTPPWCCCWHPYATLKGLAAECRPPSNRDGGTAADGVQTSLPSCCCWPFRCCVRRAAECRPPAHREGRRALMMSCMHGRGGGPPAFIYRWRIIQLITNLLIKPHRRLPRSHAPHCWLRAVVYGVLQICWIHSRYGSDAWRPRPSSCLCLSTLHT